MKRINLPTIILLLMLVCTGGLQAGVRSVEEAMAIAGRFMAESKKDVSPAERTKRAMVASLDAEPVQLAYTQKVYDNSQAAVYVFTHQTDGFVLVSADDRTRAILGYSDGAFDAEQMPENMRVWMQMYADEIARLAGKALAAPSLEDVEYYPTVEPLLGNTAWNQSAPYNDHCPIDPSTNERSVTGCMATAAAQVMYHHKYPISGTGEHSYYWRGQRLSVDFSQATYDWENMLPRYQTGKYTKVESDAVAQLMYHVGVACDMSYGSSASGAGMGSSATALMNYFGYDPAIRVLKKDYMDEQMILRKMAQDLEASRPIQIEALTKKHEGHAFVCDGMQSNGYIHINWGWGGYADGYFALSVMNPTNQGIGGASDNGAFTESVTLYLGVQPNQNGVTIPVMLVSSATLKSATAISKQEKVSFDIFQFQNGGVGAEKGAVAFLVYQDSTLSKVYDTSFNYWDLKPLYYYNSTLKCEAWMSDLAPGEYEMVLGIHVADKEVEPLHVYGHGTKRYTMTVTEDSIFMKEIIKKQTYFGTEYATMQVTDLTAKTGSTNLRMVLQTSDFQLNSKGKPTSGMALALDLMPVSENSVVGSYALDVTNSQASGTMTAAYSQIMGMVDGKQIAEKFTEGIATVTQISGGHYVINYRLKSATTSYEGKCLINDVAVKSYRQVGTKVNTFTLLNDVATTMDAAYAYAWASQLTDAEQSDMPFYIHGMVSQIEAMPTENGSANFFVSSNGAAANALRCHEAKWLGKTDFATGNEFAVKDTVLMVGYLQHVDLTTPTLHGYVFEHRVYVPNPNTGVEDIEQGAVRISRNGLLVEVVCAHACDTYVYDIMGKIVAQAPAATRHTFVLPMAGCYIVRAGDMVNKIIVE